MSEPILRGASTPSKLAARPHDPDVCGLDFDSDCDACKARVQCEERHFVYRDAEARERNKLRMIADRFAKMNGFSLQELAASLLPYLAKSMAEIAGVVFDEREARP